MKNDDNELNAERANKDSKAVLNKLFEPNDAGILSANILQMTVNHQNEPIDAFIQSICESGPKAYSFNSKISKDKKFLTPQFILPAGISHIISKLKATMNVFGSHRFLYMQRIFRYIDEDNKQRLSMRDFKLAMHEMDLGISDAEIRMLFDYFNVDHRGLMDIEHFIRSVRNPLSDYRLSLVKQAFAKLDINGVGSIAASEVVELYDYSFLPEVIARRMSAEDALKDFLETFDVGGEVENRVTLSEFINYYSNIGASIESDEYFSVMICNAWKVSGDVGFQDGRKKVLITRSDGNKVIQFGGLSLLLLLL